MFHASCTWIRILEHSPYALQDTQDRTRKRIQDDIKNSVNGYNDYAENVLPRLKRTYFKKCQEVEVTHVPNRFLGHMRCIFLKCLKDNKASTLPPIITSGVDAPALAPTRSIPSTSPVVTGPQPLRPLSRRASGHHSQSRNRSPPASNPLHDLAHQGSRAIYVQPDTS